MGPTPFDLQVCEITTPMLQRALNVEPKRRVHRHDLRKCHFGPTDPAWIQQRDRKLEPPSRGRAQGSETPVTPPEATLWWSL